MSFIDAVEFHRRRARALDVSICRSCFHFVMRRTLLFRSPEGSIVSQAHSAPVGRVGLAAARAERTLCPDSLLADALRYARRLQAPTRVGSPTGGGFGGAAPGIVHAQPVAAVLVAAPALHCVTLLRCRGPWTRATLSLPAGSGPPRGYPPYCPRGPSIRRLRRSRCGCGT